MRILTWNCRGGFTAKYPLLRDLDFDLALVPSAVRWTQRPVNSDDSPT